MITATMARRSSGKATVDWRELLRRAFSEPGRMAEVYRILHRFSIGNQVLAVQQADQRGLPIGPLATYTQWQRLGRQVRRGEKAIVLWLPLVSTAKQMDEEIGLEVTKVVVRFVLKPRWFMLAQTDGPDYSEPPAIGDWDWRRAYEALGIEKTDYRLIVPAMGAANTHKQIAVAPYDPHPTSTIVHEIAHIVLGHVDKGDQTPEPIREVQAESVAYLIGTTIGFGDDSESRDYIQHWARQGGIASIDDLSEAQVRAIFSAAEKIRQAGLPRQIGATSGQRSEAA